MDADFNAKLSDFGLAIKFPFHAMQAVYAVAEDATTARSRSDVYGFGVVLLEMLIGRKAKDKSRPSGERNLVEWARPLLNHNKELLRILDPRMEGQYSTVTAQKVANLTYLCLSENPNGRPAMRQVVKILETLQAQDVSQAEATFQSGAASSNPIELSKGANGSSREKRYSLRSESEREVDMP
ncbi:Non-specific serine/threonine protein kinase [Bertholletia excelsa]